MRWQGRGRTFKPRCETSQKEVVLVMLAACCSLHCHTMALDMRRLSTEGDTPQMDSGGQGSGPEQDKKQQEQESGKTK